MTHETAANGTIRKTADGYDIVFVRRLNKPIEKVWAALTTPERISDWFADMRFVPELRLGARVELRFPEMPSYEMTRGEVVAFDPPRLFAWTWLESDAEPPGSIVRYELAPDGDGCVLTFANIRVPPEYLTGSAAGWHVMLDALEGAAEGVRRPDDPDMAHEKSLRPIYEAQFAALG